MEDAFLYGCWKGRMLDRRVPSSRELPAGVPIDVVTEFNAGNPVTSIVSHRGFLVFRGAPSLPSILLAYYRRARDLSCGRCTPCRIGTLLICEALERAVKGEGTKVDWKAVRAAARQMQLTSLCGIGLSSPEPIAAAIDCFIDELRTVRPAEEPAPEASGRWYSAATAPCIEACPAHVNVPRYIDYVRDGRPEMAEGVLLKRYPLVGGCGRVCVRPCEKACARRLVDAPVAIKDLKRYAGDHAGVAVSDMFTPAEGAGKGSRHRVAVVGAGPAGINCAYHLLRRGHGVDVFEMESEAGGMARWGIPGYRLPRKRLAEETNVVRSLGGKFHFNQKLGRDFTVSNLFERGYEAVFLGIGCASGQYLGLPDEDVTAKGYLKGLDFLLNTERKQACAEGPTSLEGDTVVIGCGNVAMDCCRVARRLQKGGRVIVAYRRIEASAPADPEEIRAARAEGVEFEFLCAPRRIIVEEGCVTGIELVRMKQTEPDASGRRGVRPIEGSEFTLPCSNVIAAIGQTMDPTVFSPDDGIKLTSRNVIETRENYATSRPGVFAGGDAAVGAKTLILAMTHGEGAARSIDAFLNTGLPAFSPRRRLAEIIRSAKLLGSCRPTKAMPRTERFEPPMLDPKERVTEKPWAEVEGGMTDEEAWSESKRCMRCYRLIGVTTRDPIDATEPVDDATPML